MQITGVCSAWHWQGLYASKATVETSPLRSLTPLTAYTSLWLAPSDAYSRQL